MRRAARLVVLVVAGGCGMADSLSPEQDGGLGCFTHLSAAPAAPEVGQNVRLTASITGAGGYLTYTWSVTSPAGAAVAYTEVAADGSQIELTPDGAGTYHVTATGTAYLGPCEAAYLDLNVRDPAAGSGRWRLAYTPLAAQPAPPQDELVVVPGGAPSWSLGTRVLDAGTAVNGALAGPSGPLAAYLRLVPVAGGRPLEAASSSAGAFSVRLPSGLYDLLVVPYAADVAPERRPDLAASALAALTLTAGDRVSGTVRDPGGAPVAGARVAVSPGGLPASVALTGADGGFELRARLDAGPLAVTVVPPAAGAWPMLELPASAGVTAAGDAVLDLRLGGAAPVAFSASVRDPADAVLAGGRVTFVAASIGAAGSLTIDGGAPVDVPAAARVTVTADAAGALGPLALPPGVYRVVVEPPAGAAGLAPAVTEIDLTAGPPATPPALAVAAATPRTVHVADAAGGAVAGARVRAVARGAFGAAAGAVTAGDTDAAGNASLALAPQLAYDLIVEPAAGAPLAAARAVMAAGSTSAFVVVRAATSVTGTVVFESGTGQPGVHVAAFCDDCGAGVDPRYPAAETVTGAGGVFTLRLPDPGAAE